MEEKQKSKLTAPSVTTLRKQYIAQLWNIITESLSSNDVACDSQPYLRAAPESPAWARSLHSKHLIQFWKTKNAHVAIDYTDRLRAPLHLRDVTAGRRNVDWFEKALRSRTANNMATGRTELHAASTGPRLLSGPGNYRGVANAESTLA